MIINQIVLKWCTKSQKDQVVKKIVIILLLSAVQIFAFQRFAFGVNVNSNAVEFEGKMNVAPLTSDPIFRDFYIDANFINDNDTLFGLGVYVENSFYNYPPLIFQVGLKSVFTSHDNDDFLAMPIVFGVKHKLYNGNFPIGTLGAKVLYAPSPLSFQDADSYTEYRLEGTVRIIENVEIYAGYRTIDTNYDMNKINYSDSGYVGFRFIF